MEADLDTNLDWVAIVHWNTDNPHVHLLVRGVAQDGSDLVISRDYISHGLRARAEDLISAELGPRPEHEIRSALAARSTPSAEPASTVPSGWRRRTPDSSTCEGKALPYFPELTF